MKPHRNGSTVGFLSAVSVALALAAPRAQAVPPTAPTTKRWDAKCTELTLIGAADGADLGVGSAMLMRGSCPNGTMIATMQANCWD